MTSKIRYFLKTFSFDPYEIDKLLVSAFIKVNNLVVQNNILLLEYSSNLNDNEILDKFITTLNKEKIVLDIEKLIQLFEFVISPAEKEINGAIYTPTYIREYIVESILSNLPEDEIAFKKYADISCGCGGFFFTLIKSIKLRIDILTSEIINNCIYGVDIASYSIKRTKLLLALIALYYGEDELEYHFNLYVGNSLSFDWTKIDKINDNNGFDVILGNPPYISSSKIDNESKSLLKNWSVTKTGKTDLYIPFFQIAIQNLNPNGILGYITVNNFYRSLNGRAVRQYFANNRFSIKLIDFGSEQVFKGRSTYTCICFITRSPGNILYAKSQSTEISSLQENNYITINYASLNHHEGWILQENSKRKIISIIEDTGTKLGSNFDIKNGFATLKNDIYLFKPISFDNKYYYFTKNGRNYKIEKEICRDAIKPNTLKNENEINENIEKLIFPYKIQGQKIDLISEDLFRLKYPNTYNYLLENKEVLELRDKGTRQYETWYAFGRNQAITINEYKLLFPYISDAPYFVFSNQKDLLFYNGYALISNNQEDLRLAQKVLSSKLFWFYIKHTSKPYGGNYFALAKNYVKNFGYFQFDSDQKQVLLNLNDKNLINNYLCNLYKIETESLDLE